MYLKYGLLLLLKGSPKKMLFNKITFLQLKIMIIFR